MFLDNFRKILELSVDVKKFRPILEPSIDVKKIRPILEPSTTLNSPISTVTQENVQPSPSTPQLLPQFRLFQEKSKVGFNISKSCML